MKRVQSSEYFNSHSAAYFAATSIFNDIIENYSTAILEYRTFSSRDKYGFPVFGKCFVVKYDDIVKGLRFSLYFKIV